MTKEQNNFLKTMLMCTSYLTPKIIKDVFPDYVNEYFIIAKPKERDGILVKVEWDKEKDVGLNVEDIKNELRNTFSRLHKENNITVTKVDDLDNGKIKDEPLIHKCIFSAGNDNYIFLKEEIQDNQKFCLTDLDDVEEGSDMEEWVDNIQEFPTEIGIYECDIVVGGGTCHNVEGATDYDMWISASNFQLKYKL